MARGFGSTLGAGTTDVIASSYNILSAGKRSYFFWVSLNGLGGGSLGRAFDPSTTTAGVDTLFISSEWNYQRAFSGGTVTFQFPSASTPSNNTWHSILISYDASNVANAAKAWVDGVAQTITVAGAAIGTAITTSNNYYIGNRQSGGNRNWDGNISHFTIWDGILLDSDEALNLAAGTHPMNVFPDSIVTCMPLDGVNNKEFDFRNAPAFVQTGTRLALSEPPVEPYLPDVMDYPDLPQAPEDIKPDKWTPVYPSRHKYPPQIANVQGLSVYPFGIVTKEVINPSEFVGSHPDYLFRPRPVTPATIGGFSFWPGEIITPSKWEPYYPDRIWKFKPLVPVGHFAYPFGFVTGEIIFGDKWTPQYPNYIWKARRLRPGLQPITKPTFVPSVQIFYFSTDDLFNFFAT